MLLVDTVAGRLISDDELKERYAMRQPYGEWLDQNLVHLRDLPIPNHGVQSYTQEERDRLYKAFGYTYEEVKNSILAMAETGEEPSAAMGTDIPLAVLSEQHQPLFNYFKQMFAQVTNPPIDAIREEIVTDTAVYLGCSGNLLIEKPENCKMLEISNPILTSMDLMKIRSMNVPGFKVQTISILYYKNTPLDRAIQRMFVACGPGLPEGRQHPDPVRPGCGRKPCGHPVSAGGFRVAAVSGPDQEAHRRVHHAGVGGAERRAPLRHPAGLRRARPSTPIWPRSASRS